MREIIQQIAVGLATIWGLVMTILFVRSKNQNSDLKNDLNRTEFEVEKHEIQKSNSEKPLSDVIDKLKKRLRN